MPGGACGARFNTKTLFASGGRKRAKSPDIRTTNFHPQRREKLYNTGVQRLHIFKPAPLNMELMR
jgi:hypothetical protein